MLKHRFFHECGERHAVGSIKELKEMSDDCPENIELHRPFIDAVTIRCPKCGEHLGRGSPKRCPHCGTWVTSEPEPEQKKKIQHKKKKH